MTEQTDKASRKTRKAVPKKRPAKARAPKGKRAKAPGRPDAAAGQTCGAAPPSEALSEARGEARSEARSEARNETKSLAPDPATIVFGSNRPIVTQPQKLPESSGLRFSGPSAGELKASGPQPSSAKASGLTFTNAKATSGKPNGNGNGSRPQSGAKPAASEETKTVAAKPGAAAKPADKKTPGPAGKTESGKAPDRSVFTKPAIAPQASGRRLEKERSSRGFAMTLLGLAVVVGGLAYWLNPGTTPQAPQGDPAALPPAPAAQPAAPSTPMHPAAPAPAPAPAVAEEMEVPTFGPSPRAPVSPGPLVATPAPQADPTALSVAEILEIQQLLERLDLAPGNTDGVLTADTAAAIRSYQEMAGLDGNGEANRALLDELRSVVELYGG